MAISVSEVLGDCKNKFRQMTRKRTLSGLRSTLEYRNLNVFGDVVGSFCGRNVPSIEEFTSHLRSSDSCDNLKALSNRHSATAVAAASNATKPSENGQNEKSNKRSRKPKKKEEEVVGEETKTKEKSSVPEAQSNSNVSASNYIAALPAQPVIGRIVNFFSRFIEEYPSGTDKYKKFIELVKAYEGKELEEAKFYSCMKDIIPDNSLLMHDFVSLIQPDNSKAKRFEEPSTNDDFPFNIDKKKVKVEQSYINNQIQQHGVQSEKRTLSSAQFPSRSADNSSTDVGSIPDALALVNAAVNNKAKDFLLQAKSSMDPHTYVSFLDTMVELRTLYKANKVTEAIEKLDIAKGILTRVNPLLRVEMDRFFPISSANNSKHNLEHHTFEQSQRHYREWQQALVARKSMFDEDAQGSSEDKDNSNSSNWLADIAKSENSTAQQKKDRVKWTAFEKDQIQIARRVAKENPTRSNSHGLNSALKEDLLDAMSVNTTKNKRKSSSSSTRGGSKSQKSNSLTRSSATLNSRSPPTAMESSASGRFQSDPKSYRFNSQSSLPLRPIMLSTQHSMMDGQQSFYSYQPQPGYSHSFRPNQFFHPTQHEESEKSGGGMKLYNETDANFGPSFKFSSQNQDAVPQSLLQSQYQQYETSNFNQSTQPQSRLNYTPSFQPAFGGFSRESSASAQGTGLLPPPPSALTKIPATSLVPSYSATSTSLLSSHKNESSSPAPEGCMSTQASLLPPFSSAPSSSSTFLLNHTLPMQENEGNQVLPPPPPMKITTSSADFDPKPDSTISAVTMDSEIENPPAGQDKD